METLQDYITHSTFASVWVTDITFRHRLWRRRILFMGCHLDTSAKTLVPSINRRNGLYLNRRKNSWFIQRKRISCGGIQKEHRIVHPLRLHKVTRTFRTIENICICKSTAPRWHLGTWDLRHSAHHHLGWLWCETLFFSLHSFSSYLSSSSSRPVRRIQSDSSNVISAGCFSADCCHGTVQSDLSSKCIEEN